MNEENLLLSSKTRSRDLEPVIKNGYMEGAADGQSATFQSSFNIGYEQGLQFGLQLGLNQGLLNELNQGNITNTKLQDSRRINCNLCNSGTMKQEKVDNLYNKQEETNARYLQENFRQTATGSNKSL